MGKRGTIVIPARIRKRLGMTDGCLLVVEEKDSTIELRVARIEPHAGDSKVKLASSLLSAAENLGEYLAAIEEVRRMGLEPDEVPHERFHEGRTDR